MTRKAEQSAVVNALCLVISPSGAKELGIS